MSADLSPASGHFPWCATEDCTADDQTTWHYGRPHFATIDTELDSPLRAPGSMPETIHARANSYNGAPPTVELKIDGNTFIDLTVDEALNYGKAILQAVGEASGVAR